MIDHPKRHLVVAGAHNVRDLGGYPTGAGGVTQWRRLLRSAALHKLSEEGRDRLVAEGLRTVIDLRTDAELAAQPSVFERHSQVAYIHISLYERMAPVRMQAAGPAPFDMARRYCEAFETCRTAIGLTLTTIAEADDGVVLFNCTAGKDRTGVIAALLLGAAGVDQDTVIADYALTARIASPMIDQLLAAALARGGDREQTLRVLASEPATMRTALSFLTEQFGGTTAYLEEIGVDAVIRRRLAERLISERRMAEAS